MKRVLTALVLIPVVLAIILFAPVWLFTVVVAAVALLTAREYLDLLRAYGLEPFYWATFVLIGIVYAVCVLVSAPSLFLPRSGLMFFWPIFVIGSFVVFALAMRRPDLRTAFPSAGLSMVSLIYVALPLLLLVEMILRAKVDRRARANVLVLLLFVWVGDTFAYYAGRSLGRHKMAPRISPGKTWEGAVASLIGSILVGVLAWWEFPNFQLGWEPSLGELVGMAIVVNIAAQIGDLVESMIKRGAGVKDSGAILPGHGGMLDRIDALLFAAPAMWYYPEIVYDLQLFIHLR